MAENETDDVLEEASEEDVLEDASPEEDISEKKGLSKPTIIKIAIGVIVVLILAVGGYFFFLSNEELPEEKGDGISESDVASEAKKSDISTDKEKSQVSEPSKDETSTIELPQIPENNSDKADDLNNINSNENEVDDAKKTTVDITEKAEKAVIQQKELKQETEVATVTSKDVAVSEANKEKTNVASDKLPDSTIINQQTQLKSEHYQTIYGKDTRGYPWTRPAKTEPAPKPKWGGFDRLSDKK